jgi:hypothetical protein
MDLINIQYVLHNSYSGAVTTMNVQRDAATYEQMKDNVGSIFNGYIVISVSQLDENLTPIETTEL